MPEDPSMPTQAQSLDQTVAATGSEAATGGAQVGLDGAPPERIGRFVILGQLGAGGMGVVYAAIDPELERKVAVKVLHGGRDEAGTLLTEAQATAKLSHPNVVQVYEVGTHRARVYVALEYVDGLDLRQWQAAEPHDWSEVCEHYLQAGKGLAAAHAVGLVHRDFKPHNAIVGKDGRVRVLDFGLARPRPAVDGLEDADDTSRPPEEPEHRRSGSRPDDMSGTPAYMAPEQHLGVPAGPAADQFSFAVSLYEALYGERPFGGDGPRSLAYNVIKGRRRPLPPDRKVPAWLRDLLGRALKTEPADRFPSMRALLDELEAGLHPPDPLWWRYGLPAALVLSVAVAIGVSMGKDGQLDLCEGSGALAGEVWSPSRADRIGQAFEASELAFAPDAWRRASADLEAHLGAWVAEQQDNCEATRIRATQSDARMDARAECLDTWLRDADALLMVFEDPDLEVVERAGAAVDGLGDPRDCAKARPRGEGDQPPRAQGDVVRELRTRVSQLKARRLSGHAAEPPELQRALADAAAVGWEPILLDVALEVARHEELAGGFEAAVNRFEETHWRNLALGRDEEALATALELASLRGSRLRDFERGMQWAAEAEALVERTGGDESSAATLRSTRASVRLAHADHAAAGRDFEAAIEQRERLGEALGAAATRVNYSQLLVEIEEFDAALAQAERALEIRKEKLGPDHPGVATALRQVASVQTHRGEEEEAEKLHLEALATLERALGSEHPRVAFSHHRLGVLFSKTGKFDEAVTAYERAVEILEARGGADDPQLVDSLVNLAGLQMKREQLEAAEATIDRAIELAEAGGSSSFKVAAASATKASIQKKRGDLEGSVASNRKALEVLIEVLGPDHSTVADVHNNLALGLREIGQTEEAREHLGRSLEILEAKHGSSSPEIVASLNNLAGFHALQGEWDEAIRLDERALSIELAAGRTAALRGKARHFLARSLWQSGRDKARARRLVDEALAELDGLDDTDSEGRRARLKAWRQAPAADER